MNKTTTRKVMDWTTTLRTFTKHSTVSSYEPMPPARNRWVENIDSDRFFSDFSEKSSHCSECRKGQKVTDYRQTKPFIGFHG